MLFGEKFFERTNALMLKLQEIPECEILEDVDVTSDQRVVNFKVGNQPFAIYCNYEEINANNYFAYHLVKLRKNVLFSVVAKEPADERSYAYMQRLMEQRIKVFHGISLSELYMRVHE